MATRPLSTAQINELVGTHHPTAGFEYPVNGLQPYYQWLVSALHLLGEASAGSLRVNPDDATDTTIRVEPGRAVIDGAVLTWPDSAGSIGGTIDIGTFNNETVYVWLFDQGGGVAGIGHDCADNGWPGTPHIKLAEVTLSSGRITSLIDRRFETMLRHGVDPQAAASFVTYAMAIATQGSTASPTTVTITLGDLYSNAINASDYLRLRVCDAGGYTDATNATVSPTPASNTTTVQTITSGKDLVLASDPAGVFTVDVTDATAETVTLRLGPAPLSARRGDTTPTLDITHT